MTMDHRDDVTLYQTLREAKGAARTDTRQRAKSLFRSLSGLCAALIKKIRERRGKPEIRD
jgi:hypothetical protein